MTLWYWINAVTVLVNKHVNRVIKGHVL